MTVTAQSSRIKNAVLYLTRIDCDLMPQITCNRLPASITIAEQTVCSSVYSPGKQSVKELVGQKLLSDGLELATRCFYAGSIIHFLPAKARF